MKTVADGVWTWEQEQAFYGLEIGARMTALRVRGRELLLHSPIQMTPAIVAELKSLGDVAYVVAPNQFHHLYIQDVKKHFPSARLFAAPGLEKKRADVAFEAVVDLQSSFPWKGEIDHTVAKGVPLLNEVVLFHRASRTLVLTDLALHICDSAPLKTRIIFKLLGAYGKFGLSRAEKWFFIRQRADFSATLKKIFEWDFDRIVMSHGKIIASDGKARMTAAFSEYL